MGTSPQKKKKSTNDLKKFTDSNAASLSKKSTGTLGPVETSPSQSGFTNEQEKKIEEIATKKILEVAEGVEDKMEKRASGRELRIMEMLAVFIVVLTYVSTNISIFSKIDSILMAIIFMMAMSLGAIAILAVILGIIYESNGRTNPYFKRGIWIPLTFSMGMIIAMFVLPTIPQKLKNLEKTLEAGEFQQATTTPTSMLTKP